MGFCLQKRSDIFLLAVECRNHQKSRHKNCDVFGENYYLHITSKFIESHMTRIFFVVLLFFHKPQITTIGKLQLVALQTFDYPAFTRVNILAKLLDIGHAGFIGSGPGGSPFSCLYGVHLRTFMDCVSCSSLLFSDF